MINNWILLTYKLPAEPSARRVYVWRKLKRLGAITVFDAVWVLPDTPYTYEQFQWLAAEIQELGGEAMFWKARAELASQEETLIDQFQSQVEENYRSLLERMDHDLIELNAAAQEYQQIRHKDYFQCAVGLQIREKLLAAREDPL
jgi:DNA-binding transcriptional regulator PaaX